MILFYSNASPYARKVRMVAIEAGLDNLIELVVVNPRDAESGLREHNPLSRIPALVTDDDIALFDSPVIIEYLDHANPGRKLIPPPGPARWETLVRAALGDGLMDASVPRRQESVRPKNEQSPEFLERMRLDTARTLNKLETMTDALRTVDVGSIAVAAALGYLDYRFPEDRWRDNRPKLANWLEGFSTRRSWRETAPE